MTPHRPTCKAMDRDEFLDRFRMWFGQLMEAARTNQTADKVLTIEDAVQVSVDKKLRLYQLIVFGK